MFLFDFDVEECICQVIFGLPVSLLVISSAA